MLVLHLFVSEATCNVVVYESARLHVRVDDGTSDKLKPTADKVLTERIGFF